MLPRLGLPPWNLYCKLSVQVSFACAPPVESMGVAKFYPPLSSYRHVRCSQQTDGVVEQVAINCATSPSLDGCYLRGTDVACGKTSCSLAKTGSYPLLVACSLPHRLGLALAGPQRIWWSRWLAWRGVYSVVKVSAAPSASIRAFRDACFRVAALCPPPRFEHSAIYATRFRSLRCVRFIRSPRRETHSSAAAAAAIFSAAAPLVSGD